MPHINFKTKVESISTFGINGLTGSKSLFLSESAKKRTARKGLVKISITFGLVKGIVVFYLDKL